MSTMRTKPRVVEGTRWRRRYRAALFPSCCLVALLSGGPTLASDSLGPRPAYRSPSDVAYSPDGALLAVADRTWPGLVLIKSGDGAVVREVKLLGDPSHVVWNGNAKVLVAEGGNGTVAEIEVSSGTVLRRMAVGLVAKGLAVTPDGARLLTCDRASNKLVVVKLTTGEIEFRADVGREPGTVAVSSDGKYAVVGNRLPRPADPRQGTPAAEISIVDLRSGQVAAIPLVKQTTMVRHVVLSPDGKWAYVTHQSPRAGLPVTQLDNGWVMGNALSIIDVTAHTLYANFLFDRAGSGAAHPWGAAINSDGSKLWVSLEGVREVATVDLTALHQNLAGKSAAQRLDLIIDLSELHAAGIIKRTAFDNIDGPRGVALSPDGNALAVAAYFTGKVLLLASGDLSMGKAITLPDNPAEDQIREGERYYHSAMNCYQTWLSCSSCHDEGRSDGLNWDLQHDGTGNPKQTKSNVYSSETPPTTITGCRENALVSTRVGYQFIEFQAAPEDRVQATHAYLESLSPEPSPFLGPDGQLTPDAVEGKKLFEGQAGCAGCHKGSYFTDMQNHDVGTHDPAAAGPDSNPTWDTLGWDTPTLVEVWRTAPYLHLGSAMTVKDVLTAESKNGKSHGDITQLGPQQIDQLAAYVLQIGPTRARAVSAPDAGVPTSDAPSVPVVADGGAPDSGPAASADAAMAPDASGGSTGGSTGSGGSVGAGGSGGSQTASSGSAGQGGAGAGPDAQPGDRGDASARGQVALTRSGFSCHVGGASPSRNGSALLLLVGLAWLACRARAHARTQPRTGRSRRQGSNLGTARAGDRG